MGVLAKARKVKVVLMALREKLKKIKKKKRHAKRDVRSEEHGLKLAINKR